MSSNGERHVIQFNATVDDTQTAQDLYTFTRAGTFKLHKAMVWVRNANIVSNELCIACGLFIVPQGQRIPTLDKNEFGLDPLFSGYQGLVWWDVGYFGGVAAAATSTLGPGYIRLDSLKEKTKTFKVNTGDKLSLNWMSGSTLNDLGDMWMGVDFEILSIW